MLLRMRMQTSSLRATEYFVAWLKKPALCHSRVALLRGPKNPFGVIPWLDHGIQKNNKNTNNFSIFNWIPRSSRGMNRGEIEPRNNTFPRMRE